jgi:hypothetical protein
MSSERISPADFAQGLDRPGVTRANLRELHPLPPVGQWFVILDNDHSQRRLCLTSPTIYWKGFGPLKLEPQASDNIPYMNGVTVRGGVVVERDVWWEEILALHHSGWAPAEAPPEAADYDAVQAARRAQAAAWAAEVEAEDARKAARQQKSAAERKAEHKRRRVERRARAAARRAAREEALDAEQVRQNTAREQARAQARAQAYWKSHKAQQERLIAELRREEQILAQKVKVSPPVPQKAPTPRKGRAATRRQSEAADHRAVAAEDAKYRARVRARDERKWARKRLEAAAAENARCAQVEAGVRLRAPSETADPATVTLDKWRAQAQAETAENAHRAQVAAEAADLVALNERRRVLFATQAEREAQARAQAQADALREAAWEALLVLARNTRCVFAPHCPHTGVTFDITQGTVFRVHCTCCGAVGPWQHTTADALGIWRRIAHPSAPAAVSTPLESAHA